MDMLYFSATTAESRRHKHVVQLFAVIVEDIGIPFHRGDVRHLVNIVE
jgi:hypothetical protein